MPKLNVHSPVIAGAVLICAAMLSACGQSAAPTLDAKAGRSVENTPVVAAPTIAPTATLAPTPPPAPTAAPTQANPQDLLSKALTALTSAKTVRLTVKSTTASKTTTDVLEYVNPSAYHMTQSNGDEIVVIGDKGVYEKKGSKWSKLSIPANMIERIVGTVNPIAIIEKERQKLDQKNPPQVGADILGGKPMVTYQYNNPQGHAGYIKFWYGVADGWMFKFEGSDTKTKGEGTIEYNTPIVIAPPI